MEHEKVDLAPEHRQPSHNPFELAGVDPTQVPMAPPVAAHAQPVLPNAPLAPDPPLLVLQTRAAPQASLIYTDELEEIFFNVLSYPYKGSAEERFAIFMRVIVQLSSLAPPGLFVYTSKNE